MILKCNWKCKSHGAGNLSPTHQGGQPSLSCPWTSPCIHCSVHNTIIFSLSHLSPIIVTGIFFSLQCLTEKKYYPSLCPFHFSSLSLSYVFLHLNSGFFTIFFFFLPLCILNYQELIYYIFTAVWLGRFSSIHLDSLLYSRFTVTLPTCVNSNI